MGVRLSEVSAPDAAASEETLSQSESTPSEQPSEGIGDTDQAESVAVALPSVVLPTRQATTPSPVVADPEIEAALRALKRIVAKETADPHNPWAIAHGLLALGDGHVLSNGQNAVEGPGDYAQKAITQPPMVAGATGPRAKSPCRAPHRSDHEGAGRVGYAWTRVFMRASVNSVSCTTTRC